MIARQGRVKPSRKRNILGDLPLASRLIVQVKVFLSSPSVPHTDSSGGTIQPKEKTQTARRVAAINGFVKHFV